MRILRRKMRAAVYYGKEDIQVKDWPAPKPGEGEVVVCVRYTGMCGTDMAIYAGKHPRVVAPLVPGHEIFGRIEALGNNTDCALPVGARVVIYPLISCGLCGPCAEGNAHVCERLGLVGIDRHGGFAEFVAVKQDQLIAVPNEVSDEEAAVVEPLAVAVHAVRESGFRTADTVLVTGGGPIGNLVAQVARASGASAVIISEMSTFRRDVAQRMGFLTFDPVQKGATHALKLLLGRPSVDIVYEATGSASAYKDAVCCCRVRGEITFVGIPKTPSEIDVQRIVFKELRTTSARVYRIRDYLAAIDLIRRRAVDLSPLITRIPLREAVNAFAQMKAGDSTLKILLAP
jgi:(R,R)-butanediol dehydrogenase / meso-butanediol dehydrogenase / diacetyl reductase